MWLATVPLRSVTHPYPRHEHVGLFKCILCWLNECRWFFAGCPSLHVEFLDLPAAETSETGKYDTACWLAVSSLEFCRALADLPNCVCAVSTGLTPFSTERPWQNWEPDLPVSLVSALQCPQFTWTSEKLWFGRYRCTAVLAGLMRFPQQLIGFDLK
jgi:hypothetical protein